MKYTTSMCHIVGNPLICNTLICMKYFKNLRCALLALFIVLGISANAQSTVKFGYLNADSLLCTLPEYAQVEASMQQLRDKYKAETEYNEQDFRRRYAEFLAGQKQFTQNILTKRQIDLQQSLERGMAYRQQADSLLRTTHEQLLQPVRHKLNKAIQAVGLERGYEYVLNTAKGDYPFINPIVGEDATEAVKEKLAQLSQGQGQ